MLKRQARNRKKYQVSYLFLPVFTFVIVSLFYFISISYHGSSSFNWKGISSQVKDSVFELEKRDIVFDFKTRSGNKIQQWYRQKWFKENVLDDELTIIKETVRIKKIGN